MLSLGDIMKRVAELNNWTLEDQSITKSIDFDDFKAAMDYVNKVAAIAEEKGHHPDIFISFNHVRLSLTTNSEHGLSEKDFKVAKEIDKIL